MICNSFDVISSQFFSLLIIIKQRFFFLSIYRRSLRLTSRSKSAEGRSLVKPSSPSHAIGPAQFNLIQNSPVNRQASEIMAFDSEDSEDEAEVRSPVIGQGSPNLRSLMVDEKPMEDEGSSGRLCMMTPFEIEGKSKVYGQVLSKTLPNKMTT